MGAVAEQPALPSVCRCIGRYGRPAWRLFEGAPPPAHLAAAAAAAVGWPRSRRAAKPSLPFLSSFPIHPPSPAVEHGPVGERGGPPVTGRAGCGRRRSQSRRGWKCTHRHVFLWPRRGGVTALLAAVAGVAAKTVATEDLGGSAASATVGALAQTASVRMATTGVAAGRSAPADAVTSGALAPAVRQAPASVPPRGPVGRPRWRRRGRWQQWPPRHR